MAATEQPRDDGGKFAAKHGARSRDLELRFSDLRTTQGKRLQAILDAIASDLGGHEALNGSQRVLLDLLRSKLIVVLTVSDYVDRQSELITDGELIPVLGKSYLAYLNSIRLCLGDLYKGIDPRRPAKTLEEYIAEVDAGKNK